MARAIAVTLGPLATADADGIGTSQASGGSYLVFNGALTTNFDADGVCQAQSAAGAGALTLNGAYTNAAGYVIPSYGYGGTIVASGTRAAYLPTTQRIYITTAADETGVTFTVAGYVFPASGGQGPIAMGETITGVDTGVVSSLNEYDVITSITVDGATTGNVTVGAYSTVTLDTARRVIITSAGDDTGITFAITGTDLTGNLISETLTGANTAAAASALDYYTVTSIKPSGATAAAVTIGTNGVASRMVRMDDYAGNAQAALTCTVSGTVNYTVQYSNDDPGWLFSGITPASMAWIDSTDTAVVGATASKFSSIAVVPLFVRFVLNSGTGSTTFTIRQATLR